MHGGAPSIEWIDQGMQFFNIVQKWPKKTG